MSLTGYQRLQIVLQWIKRGGKNYMDKEQFVKKVCETKGIRYTNPPKIER